MLQKVLINGWEWFADVNAQILYTDRDKKSGTPFNYLSSKEREMVMNELRFPRAKNEDI